MIQELFKVTPLTPREQDFIRVLRTHCKLEGLSVFSSDDFRMLGLDRFIVDTQHGIGSFFVKLKKLGYTEQVGYKASTIPSNHMHTIKTWRWKK